MKSNHRAWALTSLWDPQCPDRCLRWTAGTQYLGMNGGRNTEPQAELALVLPSKALKDGWIWVSRDEAGLGEDSPGQGRWGRSRTVEPSRLRSKPWLQLTGWVITLFLNVSELQFPSQ